MHTGKDTTATLPESIEEFVRQCLAQTGASPRVEFVTFSGSDDDWWAESGAVFLRVTRTGALDGEGVPHEDVARLFAPAGFWAIPREPTEMLLFCPPHLGEMQGNAWVMWGAQLPPGKVSREQWMQIVPDDVVYASRAKAHLFRSSHKTTFGVDPETGNFQITFEGGTSYIFAPDGVQFQITDGATPAPMIKTLFDISRTSISWSIVGGASACWDSTGKFLTMGIGPAQITHPGGVLGLSAVNPMGMMTGTPPTTPTPSTIWKVGG